MTNNITKTSLSFSEFVFIGGFRRTAKVQAEWYPFLTALCHVMISLAPPLHL